MNYKIKQPKRILAVDPGTRYFGVVVIEDGELIYYGVKTIKTNQPPQKRINEAKAIIQKLIDLYQPHTLIIKKPKPHWSRQSKLLLKITGVIKEMAKANRMRIKNITPDQVRERICGNAKANKNEMLNVLLQKYPALRIIIDINKTKDIYWNHLFGAIVLGILVFYKNDEILK
ncbi:crossover junction endodeoxyribonuclease RuvC [Candidatus Desantisbacteria bacterium]|nr:crossover junction endodeoxyribonuclease RuvC [Candidatus Desantisbacteria bacterium]